MTVIPFAIPMDTPDRKHAFFIRTGPQKEMLSYLDKFCRPLLGSDVYTDVDGTIFFKTWKSLPKEKILPELYHNVSRLHPRADIFAPYTRYKLARELTVNEITKDGGSVEAAIRSMDHVLEGTKGRETDQSQTVRDRSTSLLSKFSMDFSQMSQSDFTAQLAETERILASVKLNPNTVLDEEKKRMTEWLIKGSFGEDSQERRNWLIATGALQASLRRAIERRMRLNEIARKFLEMREALILERTFSREIFANVIDKVRPEAIPASVVFKFPDKPASRWNYGITAILNTLMYQLSHPHVKAYRTVGREAAAQLKNIVDQINAGNRRVIVSENLFGKIHQLLTDELVKHAEVYPPDGAENSAAIT